MKLMNVTSASCCQHTHSFKNVHTHTLVQTNAGGSTHSCFILAASTKGGPIAHSWWTGRWNVPGLQPISVGLDKDVLPCDARSGFHWRKSRGRVRSKYKPATTAALTWGYYEMKNTKNSRSLEVQTDWKCRYITHVYSRKVCDHVTDQESPLCFCFSFLFFIEWLQNSLCHLSAEL